MVNKKIFIILILIIIIFSSVSLLYSGSMSSILNFSEKFKIKEKTFCRETDEGQNYYEKGATYGKGSNGEIYDEFDFCEDDATLHEWYCKGSSVHFEKHACPRGCNNGICLN